MTDDSATLAERALELAANATPGPWEAARENGAPDGRWYLWMPRDLDTQMVAICAAYRLEPGASYDAAFIAFAREALPALARALLVSQSSWAKEKEELLAARETAFAHWHERFLKPREAAWAKEKAAIERERDDACAMMEREITRCDELERQRDETQSVIAWHTNTDNWGKPVPDDIHRWKSEALARHASRPDTVKE